MLFGLFIQMSMEKWYTNLKSDEPKTNYSYSGSVQQELNAPVAKRGGMN